MSRKKLSEDKKRIIINCPFDGDPCGAQKDWNCKNPVYVGKSHKIIVAWVPCPRNKKRNIFW